MWTPDALIVITNPDRPDPTELIEELRAWSKEKQWGFLVLDGETVSELPGDDPMGISLGGDGTLLRAVRILTPLKIPLLGVNLGSLGFLSPLTSDHLCETLDEIASGGAALEERMHLEVTLDDKTHTVVNEFSITHAKGAAFTEVELYRGKEFIAAYPGDGLILSTPTGSTAYSLAAGGPVMTPELRVILITPLNPHKLGLRPLIVSPDCVLTAQVNGNAVLRGDGKMMSELPQGTRFEIRVSDTVTRLVKPEETPDWFTLLENKLHWQRRSSRKRLDG
jgi:NAD+ kinase